MQNLNPCFNNPDQKNKYKEHLIILNNNFNNTNRTNNTNLTPSDQQDICPICVSSLKKKKIVICPDCKNIIHYDCIRTWLALDKKTCIYCRSNSWEDFQLSIPLQKNKNPKYGSTQYANLGKYTNFNDLGSESSTDSD